MPTPDTHISFSRAGDTASSTAGIDISKGYGFLVPEDDAPDIFFRASVLTAMGLGTLLPGATVACETAQGLRGPEVSRIDEGRMGDDRPVGAWVRRWPDGYSERGPYRAGERHGLWRIEWPDGRRVEALYEAGALDGETVVRLADGTVMRRFYREGRFARAGPVTVGSSPPGLPPVPYPPPVPRPSPGR